MMKEQVPSVDLSKFVNGNEQERAAFVKALGSAFETYGFVTVSNHGIPDAYINEYYRGVKAFFSLPTETKRKYEREDLAGQRGYTSFGREHAKDSDAPDLKEFWQMGQIVDGDDPLASTYPENFSVDEVEYFDEAGKKLYKAFEDSGRSLLRAIALYLGLEETYFDDKIHNGNSILRAIHYPPITEEPKSAIRAEQHEDINLITLLVGASAEGLQLLTKQGEWLPINVEEGSISINVGDMLQRLTNNKLRSTTHRVVNPPREMWHTSRYSIPFFLHPRSDMDLTCLEHCVDADNPKQFEDITAGEYLDQRLREIGLKK